MTPGQENLAGAAAAPVPGMNGADPQNGCVSSPMPGLFPGQVAGQGLTPVAAVNALLYLGSEAADLLAAYRGEAERPPTAYEVAAWANRRNLLAVLLVEMWPDQQDLKDAAEIARLDWQQADAAATSEALARFRGQDPDAPLDREWARRAT